GIHRPRQPRRATEWNVRGRKHSFALGRNQQIALFRPLARGLRRGGAATGCPARSEHRDNCENVGPGRTAAMPPALPRRHPFSRLGNQMQALYRRRSGTPAVFACTLSQGLCGGGKLIGEKKLVPEGGRIVAVVFFDGGLKEKVGRGQGAEPVKILGGGFVRCVPPKKPA